MGWTKTLSNIGNMGIDAGYWRISDVSLSKDSDTVTVTLLGYSSKANKDLGEAHRTGGVLVLSGSDFPLGLSEMQVDGADPYALIYAKMAEGSATGTIKVRGVGEFDLSDATNE